MEQTPSQENPTTPFTVSVTGTELDAHNVTKTRTTTEQYTPESHTRMTTHVITVVLPIPNAEAVADSLNAEREERNEEYGTEFSFDIRVRHENAIGGKDAMSQLCDTVTGSGDTLTFRS